MKQFMAFVRKEFWHVFRDRKSLLLLFGMPIAQIVLFGFALSNEIRNSEVAICDYSADVVTHHLIQRIQASKNFDIGQVLTGADQIEEAFRAGNIRLAIVFPPRFYQELLHTRKAQVQIIADASDPNTATTLTHYATAILAEWQEQELHSGLPPVPLRISTQVRMLYNPELKGATNFVPGVMALVLLLVCVLMTSVSIVREKEMGTMEVLLVSPFHPVLAVVSKAMPYLVLSWLNLGVILLLSVFLLGLPVKGSLLLLVAASTLLIITALSLGLLISVVAASQQVAMLLSLMVMLLPTMLFTGFLFPLENMPIPLQVISHVVPSRWYYLIVKAVMIKGLGLEAIWKEMLILAGMTTLLLGVSIRKFSVRLA